MPHRRVNVMEYIYRNVIKTNSAVLVTVYGINQERRHYKNDPVYIIIMCTI